MVILCIEEYLTLMDNYMRGGLLLTLIFLFSLSVYGQTDFFSVPAGGNWNDGATWGNTSPGVEGIDWPGTGDNAFIIGDGAGGGRVNINGNYTTANVIIAYDNNRVLEHTGFSTRTLTVEGQMVGYDFGIDDFAVPTTTIVENTSRLQLVFTGTELPGATDPVLFSWSYLATLYNVTFNPPSSATTLHTEGISINGGTLRVQNGILQLDNGFEIRDASGGSTLQVDAGTSLILRGNVNGDGTSTSQFNNVSISGGVTMPTANNYFNASSFSLNSAASLTIGFSNSTNQTEGWWFQSSRPNTFGLDVNSLVDYNSTNNQNIYATTYGSLILSDGGSGATKQLVGGGTLSVQGDATIDGASVFRGNDNNINVDGNLTIIGNLTTNNTSTRNLNIGGNYTANGTITTLGSPMEVIMDGSSAQLIQGSSPVVFDNLTISNTSASVSLNNQDADINGILDIDPGTSFNPNNRTVNLASNLINDGIIVASGSFIFDGNTVLSGVGTAAFNNITISNILSAPSQTATIGGNFTNNGTFDNLNGTIDFNGNVNQTISGSATTDFYDLTISNGNATVSNNGTVNLNTTLSLVSNATFDADGSGAGVFTIRSFSTTNTARIAEIPGTANILGNVTYQRYINGAQQWHNIGLPVSGTTTNIINSGYPDPNASLGGDFARYNETVAGDINQGWETSKLPFTAIDDTQGYSFWTRTANTPGTLTFTGPLNTGNMSLPITRTVQNGLADDGWNLVNNPYASQIDWASANWTKTNIDATIYVWNGVAYTSLNGTGTIASGQSFWVHANAASPVLTATQSVKTSAAATFYRTSETTIKDQLSVTLLDGEVSDLARIRFMDDAIEEFDSKYDGYKLQNEIFNLASTTQAGLDLSINTLPSSTLNRTVKLNISNISEGSYQLKFDGLSSFDVTPKLTLIDDLLGTSTVLEDGFEYNFTVTADTTSYGSLRFSIVIESEVILGFDGITDGNSKISVYPNPVSRQLHILNPGKEKINLVSVYDVNGKVVYSKEKNISLKIDMSNMKKGIYIINIATDNKTITYRVRKE